jgi:membrane protein
MKEIISIQKLTLKDWWGIFANSGKKFIDENPFQYSAAIGYYTIFSLPGIAIFSVMIAAAFYEYDTVHDELITQVQLLMGPSSASQVEELMKQAQFASEDSLLIRIVGFAAILFSATTVFVSLQDSINSIWKIKPKPKKGIIKFIMNRLLSLAMIASIGFLILVSLMADTVLSILRDFISTQFSGLGLTLVYIGNTLISTFVVIFVFGLIFKVLPDANLKWKNVWVGAVVTTVFFVLGKFLIGFYLGQTNLGDAYGAAGSLVALLTWVYYSVLILLFGAQFTFVYNKYVGNKIVPSENAVAIRIEEVEDTAKSVTDIEDKKLDD